MLLLQTIFQFRMQAYTGTGLFLLQEAEEFPGLQYLETMMMHNLCGPLNGFLPLEFHECNVHKKASQFQVEKERNTKTKFMYTVF